MTQQSATEHRRDPIGTQPDERAIRDVITTLAFARRGRTYITRQLNRLASTDPRYAPRGARWHETTVQRALARLRPALEAQVFLLSEPGRQALREAAERATHSAGLLRSVADGTATPSQVAYVADLFAKKNAEP